MGDISAHFDKREFTCKCGKCYRADIDNELIEKLEKLHDLMNASSIIITSGFRCPEWSKSQGGFYNDAHTRGIASDIMVYKYFNTPYTSYDVAEAAERVGFSGIGIIDNYAVHVDVRNNDNYVNPHWFGNEMTGDDNIQTFQRGTEFVSRETPEEPKQEKEHTIEIIIDGNSIYKGVIK